MSILAILTFFMLALLDKLNHGDPVSQKYLREWSCKCTVDIEYISLGNVLHLWDVQGSYAVWSAKCLGFRLALQATTSIVGDKNEPFWRLFPFDLFVYLAKSCSQFATKLAGLPTKYTSSLLLVLLEVIVL